MSKRQKKVRGGALANIFSNNKVVIIISFILAVVIWFAYSIVVAPERPKTVEKVPITINLSGSIPEERGLKAYGYEGITVDVEIYGNSYAVGNAKPEDIIVTVSQQSLSQVVDVGYKKLQLIAHSADGSFTVNSISQTEIEVYFDIHETREFEVTPNIIEPEGGIAKDRYHYSGAVLSANEISISGPKAELDKISQVVVEAVVTERLEATANISSEIRVLSNDGQDVKFISYDDSQFKSISLSIQPKKKVDPKAKFENIPQYFMTDEGEIDSTKISIEYSKKSIAIAGIESQIKPLMYLEIGPIDFRDLSPDNNVFEFDAKAPNGTTIIDDTEKITVTVDMSNFTMASIELNLNAESVKIKNLLPEYIVSDVVFNDSIQIVAPKNIMDSVITGNIVAEIDFTGITPTRGANEVEITFSMWNRGDCWAYGTYTATVILN